MTDTAQTDPAFHNTSRRPIFQPSERKVLQNFINSQTRALDAQEKMIDVVKQELAGIKLRCDELIARNAQLESRDYINKGVVE
jgi:hypothetical protein